MEKMNIEIETGAESSRCNNNHDINNSLKININKSKNDFNQNSQSVPIDENNNNNSNDNKSENSNNIINMENLFIKTSTSSSPPLMIPSSKTTTTTTTNVTSNSNNSTNTANTIPINTDIITSETMSSRDNLNIISHINKINSQSENSSNNTMKKNSEKQMALIEANDSNEMYLIVNTIKKLFPNVNMHLCFNNNFLKEG